MFVVSRYPGVPQHLKGPSGAVYLILWETVMQYQEFTRVSVEKLMTGTSDIPPLCKARPDYERQCSICGHGPVVDLYTMDGQFVDSSDMCGVCAFGRQDCREPSHWPA